MAFKIGYNPKTGKSIAQTSGGAKAKGSSVYNPPSGSGVQYIAGYKDDGTPLYGYASSEVSQVSGGYGGTGAQSVSRTPGSYIPGVSQQGTIKTAEGASVAVRATGISQEAQAERERLLRTSATLSARQEEELRANRQRDYIQSRPREVAVDYEGVKRVNQAFSEAGISNAGELFSAVRGGSAKPTATGFAVETITETEQDRTNQSIYGAGPQVSSYYEPNVIGGLDYYASLLNRKANELDTRAKLSSGWEKAILFEQSGALASLGGTIEGVTAIPKAVRSGDIPTIAFLGSSVVENLIPGVKGFKIIRGIFTGAQAGAGLWYGKEAIDYTLSAESNVEAKRRVGQLVGSGGVFYGVSSSLAKLKAEAPVPSPSNIRAVKGAIQWDSVMAQAQANTGGPWAPPVIAESMRFKVSDGGDIVVPGGSIKGGFAVETIPGAKADFIQSQLVPKPYEPVLSSDWIVANAKAPVYEAPPLSGLKADGTIATADIFRRYKQNYQVQDFGISLSESPVKASLPIEKVSQPVQLDLKFYENKLTESGRYVGPGLPSEGVVPSADFVRFSDVIPKPESIVVNKVFSLDPVSASLVGAQQIFKDSGVYARLKSGVSDLRGGLSELESGGQIVGAVEEPSTVTRPYPLILNSKILGGQKLELESDSDYLVKTRIKPGLVLTRKYVNTGIVMEGKLAQDTIQDVFVRTKAKTKSLLKLEQVQTPIIDTEIRQEPIPQIYTPVRVNPLRYERPKPPKQEPPPPPRIKIPKKETGGIFSAGYDVLVRKKGIFEKVNTEPLTKSGAFSLGAGITGGSALASFKIKPAGAPAKKKGGSIFGPMDMSNFYSKNGIFIEKNTFRINTPGELKEITFKGLSSQKRKNIFGA